MVVLKFDVNLVQHGLCFSMWVCQSIFCSAVDVINGFLMSLCWKVVKCSSDGI